MLHAFASLPATHTPQAGEHQRRHTPQLPSCTALHALVLHTPTLVTTTTKTKNKTTKNTKIRSLRSTSAAPLASVLLLLLRQSVQSRFSRFGLFQEVGDVPPQMVPAPLHRLGRKVQYRSVPLQFVTDLARHLLPAVGSKQTMSRARMCSTQGIVLFVNM